MKLGILSDIHGNDLALKVVLNRARSLNIDSLVIAGDFVGYYYNPETVLDILKPFTIYACRGNHEELLQSWTSGTEECRAKLQKKYGSGYALAEKKLNNEQIKWLYSLPHPMHCTIDGLRLCIAHGSPWDIDSYIYENSIDNYINIFKTLTPQFDVVIIGHSHYQLKRIIDGTLVVNPGSVGQPRSGVVRGISIAPLARAQWAILETESMEVKFETLRYESVELLKQIEEYDPEHEYLKAVLTRELTE